MFSGITLKSSSKLKINKKRSITNYDKNKRRSSFTNSLKCSPRPIDKDHLPQVFEKQNIKVGLNEDMNGVIIVIIFTKRFVMRLLLFFQKF